jgi:hypothetical protein
MNEKEKIKGIKFDYLIPFLTEEFKQLLLNNQVKDYFKLSNNACISFKYEISKTTKQKNQSLLNKIFHKLYIKTMKT